MARTHCVLEHDSVMMNGKHECLDLADEIEEELAEAMSKHFHIALTVAKMSPQI